MNSWRAYFELVRLPAVFTAVADVMMGYLVTRGDLVPWDVFALLVAASSCLYLAGMVLNDVFDANVDARDRPERPIPSGRISRPAAARMGWALLTVGICFAWLASWRVSHWAPGFVGTTLAVTIWLYDHSAKRGPAGPIFMGMCRSLNVILAVTVAMLPESPVGDLKLSETERAVTLGVALYIAGVTWFARAEARTSNRWRLLGAMFTMLLGLACYWGSAYVIHARPTAVSESGTAWAILWLAIAAVILRRCALAVAAPGPAMVQNAVRTALRSIIVIDAAIVLGFCGPFWGCAVLTLLAPMLLLEHWASTT
jgi:4-hydroxybenzoate polyprenyltransferase